jgi:hypothetical protein
MKNIYKYLMLFVAVTVIVSCSEEDLEPTLSLDKDLSSGITSAGDLASVLNSAYDRMSSTGYYGRNFILDGDVRTDNAYSNMNSGRFASSGMNYTSQGAGPWGSIYGVIAITNIVIGADPTSLTGSAAQIAHTQGQAYAIRALAHFDLLKSYGQHFVTGQGGGAGLGIPYVKTYKDPAFLTPARGTVGSNVGDIVSDLTTAIAMMSQSLDGSSSYMTVAGAYAIGARALLYAGSVDPSLYATAGTMAKWVIDNSGRSPVGAAGFAASYTTDNASNSIVELAFSGTDNRGINGCAYILRGTSYGDVRILTRSEDVDGVKTGANLDLVDILDAADIRGGADMIGMAQGWMTVLGKYPSMDGTDNITLFRVEEMHLIYAEVMFRAGDTATALTYLNNIPGIRGLGADYYASATLENILLERRKEFYFEGLRYDDLLRTGQGMPLIDSFKQLNDDLTGAPPAFGNYRTAYPIGTGEMNANPNMVENYGY